jgi:magnesium-transporting ATPase (P-type)
MLTLIVSLISDKSKEPFQPVQLLWLNLIMDTLAALSLATELPEDASLDREPVYKDAPLISRRMWCFIAVHGVWQFVLILVLMLVGHNWFNFVEDPDNCDKTIPDITFENGTTVEAAARTACKKLCTDEGGTIDGVRCKQGTIHSTFLFNVFIWCQIFNVINARKIYGESNPFEGAWTRSRQLIIIFALIMGLQAIAVELFGRFMSTVPMSGFAWGVSIGIAAIQLPVGVLQRLIPIADVRPKRVIEREEKLAALKKEVLEEVARKKGTSSVGAATAASASSHNHDALPAGGKAAGEKYQIHNHNK